MTPSRHTAALSLLLPLVLVACSKAPPAEEPVRAVRTLTIQPGEATLKHEYAAEVRARTELRLGFRVPGKVTVRPVNQGDQVQAGQLLARLDAADLALGQDAARAALGAARSQLALSETEFKKYKELRDQGFISALELDRRDAALKAARAQSDQAQAQAALQGNQAGYAALTAPSSGVVTAVEVEAGAVLAAGTPVLRLALDGPRDVVFSVPEDRVDAVRALLGRSGGLGVKLWGQGDQVVSATVREVAASADSATRTFQVKADLGNTAVRLGQTATVLVQAPKTAAILLPLHAVVAAGSAGGASAGCRSGECPSEGGAGDRAGLGGLAGGPRHHARAAAARDAGGR